MVGVTVYLNVSRKDVVNLVEFYEIPRDRGYRLTLIADEFTLSTAPVKGGLIRILPNNDGTYNVEDHTS